MVAQSGVRVKVGDPVAWVGYDDGLTQEFPLDRLRLADFRHSVPWRQVRSRHGQARYSGSYAWRQVELVALLSHPSTRILTAAPQPQAAVAAMLGSLDAGEGEELTALREALKILQAAREQRAAIPGSEGERGNEASPAV